jgi:hypothetical protein
MAAALASGGVLSTGAEIVQICPIPSDKFSLLARCSYMFPQAAQASRSWGKRFSRPWFQEGVVVFAVFSLTGTLTVKLRKRIVQLVKQHLGVDLSQLMSSSWAIWAMSCAMTAPLYYALLFVIGTLFGRHAYFSRFAMRMWNRLPLAHK